MLDVDRSSGLVRVQAGITIRELNARLAEHGLALENLGDIDAQSIAGAISTATHGTGARLRNISAQVAELTLVLADGSTLRCAEELDPEVFRAARVGLGALGVIAEVTLRCVPAFTLRGVDAPAPLADTLARFEELALGNDHFEFFVFPHADTALTRTNNRTDRAAAPARPGRAPTPTTCCSPTTPSSCSAAPDAASRGASRSSTASSPASPGAATRVDRSDRIFASPRLVRFTEMEYALPRERTPEAVRRVMALDPSSRASPCRSRSRCARSRPTTRCSAPPPAATAASSPCTCIAGMAWEPYFRAVEAIMDELGGRPHWGKRHFQTAATLRPRYPDWDRFQAVRARLDPEGRFANAWTERVLGPVDAVSARDASA